MNRPGRPSIGPVRALLHRVGAHPRATVAGLAAASLLLTGGGITAAVDLSSSDGVAQQPLARTVTAAAPPRVLTPSTSPGAVAAPTPTVSPLAARLRPDVTVSAEQGFSPELLQSLGQAVPTGLAVVRRGQVTIAGTAVNVLAVDPSTFRAFAPEGTAESDGVWQSVARGEMVLAHAVAEKLALPLGEQVPLMAGQTGTGLRLGALATVQVPGVDMVVSYDTGVLLGITTPDEAVATAGDGDPVAVANTVREVVGPGAEIDLLTEPPAPTAFLAGSSATKVLGSFRYTVGPHGSIAPDSEWVSANIRTETIPIMGSVTCHKVMLPQLKAAMAEIQAAGLAGSLHTYDGCYVPRFIASDVDRSISLHTWGIAIDLDAATNGRGTTGTMDPQIVSIMARWGFRWGGKWSYTDPMHFELGAIITPQ